MDEVVSLMLIQHTPGGIIEERLADRHPPGYFLALKAWVKAGKLLHLAPSIGWARLLNVAAWLGLVAGGWVLARRLLPVGGVALLIWCLGASAPTAQMAKELRGYGFAYAAVTLAFLLAVAAVAELRAASRQTMEVELSFAARRRVLACWAGFAAAAVLALWTHMLSGLTLLLITAALPFLLVRRTLMRRAGALTLGVPALAVATALAAFAPWALLIGSRWGSVIGASSPDKPWMTPPTVVNLADVFLIWYPFGPVTRPDDGRLIGMRAAGGSALLLPLLAAGWAAVSARRNRHPSGPPPSAPVSPSSDPGAPLLISLGLALSAANVLILWTADRCDWAQSFHGPRYNVFTAGCYAAAVAALSWRAARRLAWPPAAAWLLAAPWLVCSAVGQVLIHQEEQKAGLAALAPVIEKQASGGQALIATPEALIPYSRRTLERLNILGGPAALAFVPETTTRVVLLDLNPWRQLEQTPERVLEKAAEAGRLSRQARRVALGNIYSLIHLEDFQHEAARELANTGFQPRPHPVPPEAISIARTEDQRLSDDWAALELEPDLSFTRWGLGPCSRIRFDRPVPAGWWELHLIGYRNSLPTPEAPISISFEGTILPALLGAGPIHLRTAIRLDKPSKLPVLEVCHPVWKPAEHIPSSGDHRPLTFQFHAAWLEPRSDGTTQPAEVERRD